MLWIIAIEMAAQAAPSSLHAAAYTEAAEQCARGDADVCSALSELAFEAWLPSVWAAQVDGGHFDSSWRAAMRAFERAATCARLPTRNTCSLTWGQTHYPFRQIPLEPICAPEDPSDCVTLEPAVPVEHPGTAQPHPLGSGWATVAHGRVFPRDARESVLVEGAGAGWGDADAWVFVPTFTHGGAVSSTVSILDADGWRDVELDLGGEGVCAAWPGRIRVSREGRCNSPSTTTRGLDASGRLVDLPGIYLDHAGDYALTYEDGAELRLFRGDELLWSRNLHSVQGAIVSVEGRVAFERFGEWTIVDGEEEIGLGPWRALQGDWAGGSLYLLRGDHVVSVDLDGRPRAAWKLPWKAWSVVVHPEGHSFWAVNADRDRGDPFAPVGQVFSFGDTVPRAELPAWLTSAPAHRLPWGPPSEDGTSARVLLEGQPLEGAFVQGQYTDAEGRFVRQGRVQRVWVDGLRRPFRGGNDGDLELEPLVMTRLPAPSSGPLSAVPGAPKLRKAVDLGDGAIGIVRPEEHGRGLVDGLDAMVTVEGDDASWTQWDRGSLRVVDEEGRPLAGILVGHPSEVPGADRAQVGIDGRVSLREVDAPLMYHRREGRREGDRLVFPRDAPVDADAAAPQMEVQDLAGRWHLRDEDGLSAEEYVFVPVHGTHREGRVVEHDKDWFVPLDAQRMLQLDGPFAPYDANVEVDAWERPDTSPSKRSSRKRFVGRFGWSVGDRITRTVDGQVVEEGAIEDFDGFLQVAWSLQASGGPFPGARTTYVTADGRFLGLDHDDYDVFQEQLQSMLQREGADAERRKLAYHLFQPVSGDTWREMAAQAWFAELGALVGRELIVGEPVVVQMGILGDRSDPERVELEYLGRERCDLGRCARVAITRREGEEAQRTEWWLDPDTLRPARRQLATEGRLVVEAWAWTD